LGVTFKHRLFGHRVVVGVVAVAVVVAGAIVVVVVAGCFGERV
jgi:hypothetical protein